MNMSVCESKTTAPAARDGRRSPWRPAPRVFLLVLFLLPALIPRAAFADIEYQSQELKEKIQGAEQPPEQAPPKQPAPVGESTSGNDSRKSKIPPPAPGTPCPFTPDRNSIRYEKPLRIAGGQSVTYTNYDLQAFIQDGTMRLHVCRNREHVRTIRIKRRNVFRPDVKARLNYMNELDITLNEFDAGKGLALLTLRDYRFAPELYPDIAGHKEWISWSWDIIRAQDSLPEPPRKSSIQSEWDDWDTEEDPFGNIMHTSRVVFEETDARAHGGDIAFRLNMFLQGREDEDERVICTAARAYVTADRGATWHTVPLARATEDKTNSRETWEGRIARSELTQDNAAPVLYVFSAEDSFGNLTTELPPTDPGWPADPAAFFPAAGDMDNSVEIVPDALDVLDNWVARDHMYLYVASRFGGPVSPGTARPPYYHIYIAKFTNPDMEPDEGLMVGTMQAFAPMISYPSELINIPAVMDGKAPMPGFARHLLETISTARKRQYSVGIGGPMLYSRTDLKALCPPGCNVLRMVFFTAANPDNAEFMPLPVNASHFTTVIFGAHTLGGDAPDPAALSGAPAPHAPAPASLYFPAAAADAGGHMTDYLSPDDVVRETGAFERWLLATAGDLPASPDAWVYTGRGILHEGPGPFTIKPADVVIYKNYRFEAYTRNGRLKVRIYRDDELKHTIMIGPDTKPRRDEQHDTGEVYITLSNFNSNHLSCDITIRDQRDTPQPDAR